MDNIKNIVMRIKWFMSFDKYVKISKWPQVILTTTLLMVIMMFMGGFSESSETYNDIKKVEFVRNYDGDTITVNIIGWPYIIGKEIPIRVGGIDTPEIRGECMAEKVMAIWAKDLVYSELSEAKHITITSPTRGKYFRIVGDVIYDGKSLTETLLKSKLGIPYNGGTKTNPWCYKKSIDKDNVNGYSE